jgi:anti-anti-sigma factor
MAHGIESAAGTGRFAVVTFPEHVDAENAVSLGDQLRAALRNGAPTVVADMSATAWCDHAGADALIRAYQAATVGNAELRLVVRSPAVDRLVTDAGLDRLVAIFRSVEAATAEAAGGDDALAAALPVSSRPWPAARLAGHGDPLGPAELTAPVLRQLIDALDDGILLADEDGTIVLASRRLAEIFQYAEDELTGQAVETLVPADLRDGHRRDRAEYARAPVSRPMAGRTRLVGVRKDGSTTPVTITLSPVPTAGQHFILAVVRDATRAPRQADLASLARAAAAERELHSQDLLGRVVSGLLHVGISLEAAADQPAQVARERITEALSRLDEVILKVRDHLFRARGSGNTGSGP